MLREQHFPKNAYGRGVSFRAKREGFWVSPANPWAAKPIVRACRTIKRREPHLLHNLHKNVCFLHNPDKKLSPQFVMHCDWCSLLNGICHTIKTNAGNGEVRRAAHRCGFQDRAGRGLHALRHGEPHRRG